MNSQETAETYTGALFKRGLLTVTDIDRALTLWVGVLGMEVDSLNEQNPDSLIYQLFDIPAGVKTRFATLNAGPDQQRTLGILEVKDAGLDPQSGIRRGGVVINANGRIDAIKAALAGLGLRVLREKPLKTHDGKEGTETGFFDWDGNLIVLFELP